MKKKLEAELISIAHKILKLKSKEDVKQLHSEARNVYEKLSVLLFVEENFNNIKPTIGLHDIEEVFENISKNEEVSVENEIFTNSENNINDNLQPTADVEEIILSNFELEKDNITLLTNETLVIKAEVSNIKQIPVQEFVNIQPVDLVFERVLNDNETQYMEASNREIALKDGTQSNSDKKDLPSTIIYSENSSNLNQKLNKNLNLSLNDRLAFEQELFDFSKEDFNRVLNQISTFESFDEAKNFINEMVKPDYNNWEKKEEFVNRFMTFVESKFI